MFPDRTHSSSTHFITSSRNPLLKAVRRAAERGTLTEKGFCVAETPHLLEEALRSRCEIDSVLAAESAADQAAEMLGSLPIPLLRMPDQLFASVAATENSQGVIALVRPNGADISAALGPEALVTILDGLQD